MNNYSPNPTPATNHLQNDWGNSNTKLQAQNIKHVASKVELAIQMLKPVVGSLDVIEKELIDVSNAQTMPTREGIRAFAYRIDAPQNQVTEGLKLLEDMLKEIHQATEQLSQSKSSW